MMNGNVWKYYGERCLLAMIHVLNVGSVIQTFLMEQGISEQVVSNYMAILSVVQMVVMLSLSGKIENVKNVIKGYALTALAQILLFAVLIYFSIHNALPVDIKYGVILVAGVVTNVFYGANVILNYKLPFHVLDMGQYGKVMGKSGIISGLAGTAFSALLAYCVGRYDYFQVMTVFFGVGAVMILIMTVIIFLYVPVRGVVDEEKPKTSKSIFGYKVFHTFCIPDLLRGFAAGLFSVVTVIGYYYDILNVQIVGVMTVAIYITTIISCYIYSKIVNQNNNRKIILLSSVLMMIFLPGMLVGKSVTVFCVMYVIVHFAYTLINYAVPVMVTEMVDYEYIGQYSAWRMLLHTGGTAAAGFVATYMLEWFGGIPTLMIAGGAQLLSGAVYYLYNRETQKIALPGRSNGK